MTSVSLMARTEPAVLDETPKYYPFNKWTAPLAEWIRLSSKDQPATVRIGYTSFQVPNLALSLATDRWMVRWPGHPDVTLDDLRSGLLPEPTAEEVALRKRAIQEARQLRPSLDITPLTTSALIRRLRDGSDAD